MGAGFYEEFVRYTGSFTDPDDPWRRVYNYVAFNVYELVEPSTPREQIMKRRMVVENLKNEFSAYKVPDAWCTRE